MQLGVLRLHQRNHDRQALGPDDDGHAVVIIAITTAKLERWVLTMMVMLSSSIVVGFVRIGTANRRRFDEIERWLGVVMSFVFFLADGRRRRPCSSTHAQRLRREGQAGADGPVSGRLRQGPSDHAVALLHHACTRRPSSCCLRCAGVRGTRGSKPLAL